MTAINGLTPRAYAYEDIVQARSGLNTYFDFYNTKRKHQILKATPDEVYYADQDSLKDAA